MAPRFRRRLFDDYPHNTKWQIKIVNDTYVVYAVDTQESHTFNNYIDATEFIYNDVRATYPWKFPK